MLWEDDCWVESDISYVLIISNVRKPAVTCVSIWSQATIFRIEVDIETSANLRCASVQGIGMLK